MTGKQRKREGKTKGHRSDLNPGWLPYGIWSPAHPSKLNRRLDSCLFLSHNLYHGCIDTHAVGWIWMIFIVNKLKKIAAYAAPECVKLIKYKRGWLHNKLKYLRCTTNTYIYLFIFLNQILKYLCINNKFVFDSLLWIKHDFEIFRSLNSVFIYILRHFRAFFGIGVVCNSDDVKCFKHVI